MSVLKREEHPMPDFIKQALLEEKLMEKYFTRPAYQKNDYIGWITSAKRQETQAKRLNQMLSELKAGNKYMGMKYRMK
jgi:uncharacterized protein YdeI (YjbR/CyaY-like superfamily)